jgi:hypothetical protein
VRDGQQPGGGRVCPLLRCLGKERNVRNIIYIIGLIVVVLFILSLLGLR